MLAVGIASATFTVHVPALCNVLWSTACAAHQTATVLETHRPSAMPSATRCLTGCRTSRSPASRKAASGVVVVVVEEEEECVAQPSASIHASGLVVPHEASAVAFAGGSQAQRASASASNVGRHAVPSPSVAANVHIVRRR